MPGSRDVEIERHLPVMLETAKKIREARSGETLVIWPAAVRLPH